MKTTLPTLLSVALFVLASASGCNDEPNENVEDTSAESSTAALHGRYRFVLDEARRTKLHAELASKLSGAELDQAKRAIDEEVATSIVEFTKDGRFRSLVADQVLIDAAVTIEALGDDRFQVKSPEKDLLVQLEDGDLLVMQDPKKGDLTFERLR
jgi:hypothetical protein